MSQISLCDNTWGLYNTINVAVKTQQTKTTLSTIFLNGPFQKYPYF